MPLGSVSGRISSQLDSLTVPICSWRPKCRRTALTIARTSATGGGSQEGGGKESDKTPLDDSCEEMGAADGMARKFVLHSWRPMNTRSFRSNATANSLVNRATRFSLRITEALDTGPALVSAEKSATSNGDSGPARRIGKRLT